MLAEWMVSPPVAFGVVLIAAFLLSRLVSGLAFKPKRHNQEQGESYACGEANYDNAAQPDYSTFFPFAFFFTLAHVAALVVTTAPAATLRIFGLACLYITGVAVGLYVLLRRE